MKKNQQNLRFFPGGTLALVLALVMSICVNLLVLSSPLYMMQLFDRVLPTGNTDTLMLLSIIAVSAIVVFGILDALRQSTLIGMIFWWEERAEAKVFETALTSSVRAGREPNLVSGRDVAAVRNFMTSPFVWAFFDAPWVPIFIATIWLLHPELGQLSLLVAALLFSLTLLNDRLTRAPSARAHDQQMQLSRKAAGLAAGVDSIEAMGMRPGLVGRHRAEHAILTSVLSGVANRTAAIAGIARAIRMGAQILILGLGAYLVVGSELAPGDMIAASIIFGRALAPVEQSLGAWRAFGSAREAYRRICALDASIPDKSDQPRLPDPVGRLAVANMTYTLPKSTDPVVAGVNLKIEPGTVLGVIGPSGSGKSTLCRLVVGALAPTSGEVRLDGADMRQWSEDQRNETVGYVSQDCDLFEGTVGENISRFGNCADHDVVAAALAAGCHEMILRLPDGYATQLTDNGRPLSGGEKQKVALARALFRMPRFLVLDEANAFLDSAGENEFVRCIENARANGAGVMLVTHRPTLLDVADTVAVMRDGRIAALGPRGKILDRMNGITDGDKLRGKTACRPPLGKSKEIPAYV